MKRPTRICSAILLAMGAAVLAGWAWNIEIFKRMLPGLVAMNPATAIAFMLGGLALWLSVTPEPARWQRQAGLACGLAVALIGFLKCGAALGHWRTGVDQILFAAKLQEAPPGLVNRMAPNTAFSFLLGGMALSLLDWNAWRRWHPAEILSLAVGLLSLLAVTGYTLNAISFYRVPAHIPMALHTALGFLALVTGIVCARPQRGLARLLASPGAGGTTLRRLLPAAILVPLFLGLLRSWGEQAGAYDVSLGVALMIVATMAAFTALIFSNAVALERADEARRLAEEKIHQLNGKLKLHADQLESANQELEAFSYSVSHDLRAPLRAVDGFSNILLNKYSSEIPMDAQRLVNTIISNARQMGQLIDDLLRLSKLGRQSLSKRNVKIYALVQEIVEDLRREHSGRAIEVRIADLPDSLADHSLLKQVLVNLLSNAFKFTRQRENAQIEVGWRQEQAGKVYFVRDNGAGFNMQYAQKLFGVFQRLHRAEQFEGTGVGLSIVQRIVQRHGGKIWAEAEVDKGATFYFSLPD